MYEAAIADCRNCTIGTAPVTEPGQVEALRPWQPGGPRGGGRGGGRGEDREGEVLKVVEHLEVEDLGLGGALGGAGGGHSRPGLEPGGLSPVTASAGAAAGSAAASGSASPCCGGLELAFRSGESS